MTDKKPLVICEIPDQLLAMFLALGARGDFAATKANLILAQSLEAESSGELIERQLSALSASEMQRALEEVERARNAGVTVLCPLSLEYPRELRSIADPPAALFVRGRLDPAIRLAIVGSRRCTRYGHRVAKELGRAAVDAGAQVVSGLAFGIDAAAHEGSIEAAQKSGNSPGVAVLGSGVGEIQPREHLHLAEQLLQAGGAIVSEYGLSATARKHFFPRRNRLISGLSRKVVIVEAAVKSGSLITARLALEQGRDLAAVPGPIDSELSAGTNDLLRQGAQVLSRIRELFEGIPELEPPQTKKRSSRRQKLDGLGLSQAEQKLAAAICEALSKSGELSAEQLCEITSARTGELLGLTSLLELGGIVTALPGNCFELARS